MTSERIVPEHFPFNLQLNGGRANGTTAQSTSDPASVGFGSFNFFRGKGRSWHGNSWNEGMDLKRKEISMRKMWHTTATGFFDGGVKLYHDIFPRSSFGWRLCVNDKVCFRD